MEDLIQQTTPEILLANTSAAAGFSPEQFAAEKAKWLKPIRLKKLYWILTKIGNRRQNDFCDFGGFVGLNSRYLQKNLGTRFSADCLTILKNLGVILPDRFKYQVGVRPRAFRITSAYENQKRTVINDWGFDERASLPEYDEEPRENICQVHTEIHQHLLDSLRNVKISGEAIPYLRGLRLPEVTEEDCLRKIQRIQNRVWCFQIDRYGRIYSNVTGLTHSKCDLDNRKIELRRFSEIDGVPLVETDIHASHPFLCADFYSLATADASAVAAEKRNYLNLFKTDFYGEMSKALGTADRATVKHLWLAEIINVSRPKTPEAKILHSAFVAKFPILADCMRLKRIGIGGHRRVSHHLMRLESHLMIESACRTVYDANKAPLVTVHDSILHRPEDTALVRGAIENAFRNHFGVVPRIK